MKVKELLGFLLECDPEIDVLLDLSAENSPIFKAVSIDTCEEIEIDGELVGTTEVVVLLSPHDHMIGYDDTRLN